MDEETYIPIADMTPEYLFTFWPNLTPENFCIASEPTIAYNCVAWISGIKDKWIQFYYNDEGEIDEDQSSFKYVAYFKTLGFVECENHNFEPGMEKIAFYENRRGEFTHVCIQLEDGIWASKMGKLEDIEHTDLEALEGKGNERYGRHAIYMKRAKV